MLSFPPGGSAVVIGASGAIGGAMVRILAASGAFATVVALSRGGTAGQSPSVITGRIDMTDEASIAAAAGSMLPLPAPRLVLVATGLLHQPGLQPEKTFRSLEAEALMTAYRVNAIGPALVGKHFLPLLPARGKCAFAALSARVGSIGDNRLGGWHGYRAAKAALNMMLRNLAIELARRRPEALCVGLHPGTVASGLSAPFQQGVAEGKLFTPDFAARRLLAVLEKLEASQTGEVFAWDGQRIEP